MLSEGQLRALAEIRQIADAGNSIDLLADTSTESGYLVVDASVDTRFSSSDGGISFRPRERLLVWVPTGFPWEIPDVLTLHDRWAGRPHVLWKRWLCLYLAPDVEWNPSDGMHGFMDRLMDWLALAAKNQLDPFAAPLHPPLVATTSAAPTVVPLADTPRPETQLWLGVAQIDNRVSRVAHLFKWIPLGGDWRHNDANNAVAILSHSTFPYEYPEKFSDLVSELEQHGLPRNRLLWLLRVVSQYNKRGTPLFVVIGTPMRGLRGLDERQHLTVWHISKRDIRKLRNNVPLGGDVERFLMDGGPLTRSLVAWAEDIKLDWCQVDEARPEVTRSRDEASVMAAFSGRTVVLLGCGAIGSHLAEHLVRGGVAHLTLVDRGRVRVGHLSRQSYDYEDLSRPKVEALRDRIVRVRPELKDHMDIRYADALHMIGEEDSALWEADVVIDGTANATVAKRLEADFRARDQQPWMVSLLIGHLGTRGLLTVTSPEGRGGPERIRQRTKLACLGDPSLSSFAEEFWPDPPRTELFLPEPGCSSPTFIGANADIAAVVALMVRETASALQAKTEASATLVDLGTSKGRAPVYSRTLQFSNPIKLRDSVHDFTVHIEQPAMTEISTWIQRGQRLARGVETGGVLFGQIDHATKTITLTTATGPPPDSQSGRSHFVCGVEGIDTTALALAKLSQGTHRPIGMWHTHPDGNPMASPKDLQAMMSIVHQEDRLLPEQLLLVVGGQPLGTALNAYLCDRKTKTWPVPRIETVEWSPPKQGRIGLALSGGGLRAVAFHLGCLRALNDRGLLEQVSVVSGVSAGSLVAALWAYMDVPFTEFDARVMALLQRGLIRRIIGQLGSPSHLIRTTATTLTAGLLSLPNVVLGPGGRLPRTTSRTTALQSSLERIIGDRTMGEVGRKGLDVVLNSCDLRTGSAFRFGSVESGSWRHGVIKNNTVPVAKAVACSAAYPVFFPAMDWVDTFVRPDGIESQRRVILSDGGLFDNLGTSCLLPGRSPHISTNVHEVDCVIACDADRGLFEGRVRPYWWAGRMKRSFESVYRRSQLLERGRLFSGAPSPDGLERFVIAMLGMQDHRLPVPVPDLVPRSAVVKCKTGFTALPPHDISNLTKRGEQIMSALANHYLGDR